MLAEQVNYILWLSPNARLRVVPGETDKEEAKDDVAQVAEQVVEVVDGTVGP